MDGRISPQSFSKKRILDKTVHGLMQKVEVGEIKEFTEQYPNSMPTKIRVKMIGGEEYSARVDYPKGHPQRPLTDRDLELKFHALAARRLGGAKVARLIDMVWNLDTLKDVRTLVTAMPEIHERERS